MEKKKYKHITEYERIQIEALRRAGRTITQIAEQLQKNYSSIWRELQRGKYTHLSSVTAYIFKKNFNSLILSNFPLKSCRFSTVPDLKVY